MADYTTIINGATVPQLKNILNSCNLPYAGTKIALKLRLEEAIQSPDMDRQVIANAFVQHARGVVNGDDIAAENEGQGDTENQNQLNPVAEPDNESALNEELASLRRVLAKKREIANLKQQLCRLNEEDGPGSVMVGTSSAMVSQVDSRPSFHFKDIENSIQTFSGDDNLPINRWLQLFEETADLFEWNSLMRFIYSKRLMVGTAKLFLRTVSVKSWSELKRALLDEFERKISAFEIHDMLRNRKKKSDENLQQYVLAMQEIGNLASVDEQDVLHYIVDGIPDSSNKMLLYGANSFGELKNALQKYERLNQHASTSVRSEKDPADRNQLHSRTPRCYNCNENGHLSTSCTKPKRPKDTCYRCGKSGHFLANCPETVHALEHRMEPNNYEVEDEQPVQQIKPYVSNVNEFEHKFSYRFIDQKEHQLSTSSKLSTLLDSGSPIRSMQERYIPVPVFNFMVNLENGESGNFCELNNSPLEILGSSKCIVNVNDAQVRPNLYIEKKIVMKYPVILGRVFLKINDMQFSKIVKEPITATCEKIRTDEILYVMFLTEILLM